MFEMLDRGYMYLYPDRAVVNRAHPRKDDPDAPRPYDHTTTVQMALELIGQALRASATGAWEINLRGEVQDVGIMPTPSDPLGQRGGTRTPVLVVELIETASLTPEYHLLYQRSNYSRPASLHDVLEALRTRYTQWMVEGAAHA